MTLRKLAAVALVGISASGWLAGRAHDGDPKALVSHKAYVRPMGLNGGYSSYSSDGGFPAQGVELLDWKTLGDFGPHHQNGNSLWGYVSPSGREYALMGLSDGLGVVDVSNPRDARIITEVPGPESLWRDVRVYQSYAYAVSEGGGGIQVIDLTDVDNDVVTLVGYFTQGGGTATHTVAIDETSGFLYRAGGDNNGLRIYDLADPRNPAYVGAWPDRYVHETTPLTYTSGPYAGRQIAFCCGGLNGGWTDTGLDVVDVTDKSAPLHLKHVTWPLAGYSHQGWYSPDLKYFYIDDELDEYWSGLPSTTITFDISDPGNPIPAGTFTNGNTAIGHNQYTRGKYLYQANYRSGLRIFDATNPTSPVEVAYFDTWPSDDGVAFNGLWNVYPYFPSGTIIGSDLEKGLFVWRFGDPPVTFHFPDGLPRLVDPDGDSLKLEIHDQLGIFASGSARLHVDRGAGFEVFELTALGGRRYRARFPAAECATRLRYYFSLQTVHGETILEPKCAPEEVFRATAANHASSLFKDDFESDRGWQIGVGGDTAAAGIWERVDPQGTTAQPTDDHGAAGTRCFVTDGRAGIDQGDYDVDGGKTTLVSPVVTLGRHSVVEVSYWRWYSNSTGDNPNADEFKVDVSADGSVWVEAESVGPFGPGTAPGWHRHAFFVQDVIGDVARVQVRFVASDEDAGSIVEAALDDFEVRAFTCDVDTNGRSGSLK